MRLLLIGIALTAAVMAHAAKKKPCASDAAQLDSSPRSEATQRLVNLTGILLREHALLESDLADLVARDELPNPVHFASGLPETRKLAFEKAFAKLLTDPAFEPGAAREAIRALARITKAKDERTAEARKQTAGVPLPFPVGDGPIVDPFEFGPSKIYTRKGKAMGLFIDRQKAKKQFVGVDLETGKSWSAKAEYGALHLQVFSEKGKTFVAYIEGGPLMVAEVRGKGLDWDHAPGIPAQLAERDVAEGPWILRAGKDQDAYVAVSFDKLQPTSTLYWYRAADGENAKVHELKIDAKIYLGPHAVASGTIGDKSYLAIGVSSTQKVIIADATTGERLWEPDVPAALGTTPLYFESGGEPRIAVRTRHGLQLLDPVRKQPAGFISSPHEKHEDPILVEHGGRHYALLPRENDLAVVDLDEKKMLPAINTGRRYGLTNRPVGSVNGHPYVTWIDTNERLVLADFLTHEIYGATKGGGPGARYFVYEADGRLMAAISDDRPIKRIQLVGPVPRD